MKVVIPYNPRPLQLDIHKGMDERRWAVLVIHRRFGKTVMLINHMIRRALTCTADNPRFLYLAPFRNQAKRLAWDYLKKFTEPIPGRKIHETELRIDFTHNNARIYLDGADNAEAHRGIYLDGAVLDEYKDINPNIFSSILRPALSDRQGWCVFSGTPNGRDHFFEALTYAQGNPDIWFSIVLKASETGYIDEAELRDARRTMSEEAYEREYECSFDFVQGKKIYPEYNHKIHLSHISLSPTRPTTIYRGWDNTGLSPAIILMHITSTGQLLVFKEFCFFDVGIAEATESMLLWCNANLPQGCKFVDYADPAGKNRDSTKMSPRDYIILRSRELGQEIWPMDGIQTWDIRRESVAGRLTRMVNGEPAMMVDAASCPKLVEGFAGAYAYREIANMPGFYSKEAIKNHVSHIHDALQYPLTRLFMNTSGIETPANVISLEDDRDFNYHSFDTIQTGRSAIAGY
jgi:hypothetical protein